MGADLVRLLSHIWYGYLLIELSGYSPERFLNLCSANNIEIWKLRYLQGSYYFYITVREYRKIKPFARKAEVKLKIIKKSGMPFFLYRNRKRKCYAAGVLIFFLLLYSCSLFIWDIEFDGNRMYTDDTLLRFFSTQSIDYGMFKENIDCDELEAAIRNNFPEITWVSARVSGTRLLVKLKENEVLSSIPQKDESACDLTAAEDGIITRIVVRQGIVMVKPGDAVEKGQVLISGLVPITDDSGEAIKWNPVHADGEIYARTDEHYQKNINALCRIDVETGRKRRGCQIRVFDYQVLIMLPDKKERSYKYISEEKQLKLFGNFYLPVYLKKITGKEYTSYERSYTEDELKKLSEEYMEQIIKKLIEKGVQIIKNDVKILDNELEYKLDVQILAEKNIGQIQRISEPEEMTKPDEHNGDNN